jgi:hypothetical protein
VGPITPAVVALILEVLWELLPDDAKSTAARMAFAFAERIAKGEQIDKVLREPLIWAEVPSLDADRVEMVVTAITGAYARRAPA